MTDEEILKAFECCCGDDVNGTHCKDCPAEKYNFDWCSDEVSRQMVDYTKRLQAENAALKERLSKAAELPCKLRDKLYYVNEYLDIPKINEYTVTAFTILPECIKIYVGTGDYFLLDENVCFTPEAAEARLNELQGNNNNGN